MFKIKIQIALLLSAFVLGFTACNQGAKQATAEEPAAEEPAAAEMEATAGLAAGTYMVADGATVEWVGKKVTGQHNGTIDVKGGQFMVENGEIVGGSFTMDLNSITALDLAGDPETQAKLEGHLKSDDFFNVELNPEATFEITEIMPATEGDATHMVKGNLTIKNITNEVSFPATVSQEGDMVKIQANTTIDRTLWDIKFRSGKFFEDLGDKLIYDDFEIAFDLQAKPEAM